MPAKKATSKPAPFRTQISIIPGKISEDEIRTLAARRSKPHLVEIDHTAHPEGSKERTVLQNEIRDLICGVVRDAAAGDLGEGYQLSEHKEEFFRAARSRKQENEATSQAEAIRTFLRLSPDAPIVLSELELANAAVRAAREQNRGADYGIDDLIREGIAMISQSIISKHVATINTTGRAPDNLPGSGDDQYLEALNELRALRSDPDAWYAARYRADRITVSILARKAGTNDVQIRNFIKRHRITDVYDPKAAKLDGEQA